MEWFWVITVADFGGFVCWGFLLWFMFVIVFWGWCLLFVLFGVFVYVLGCFTLCLCLSVSYTFGVYVFITIVGFWVFVVCFCFAFCFVVSLGGLVYVELLCLMLGFTLGLGWGGGLLVCLGVGYFALFGFGFVICVLWVCLRFVMVAVYIVLAEFGFCWGFCVCGLGWVVVFVFMICV